ncbi:hypothetical protein DFH28DRAFT_28035 [Melampsora americana]|nr:hypothetical protein DFH28DRAFT_28035 [Melampsora americana]
MLNPMKKVIKPLCCQVLLHLFAIKLLTYVSCRPLMQVENTLQQMAGASSRNRLRIYLEKPIEERQNQKPFFSLSNYPDSQTQQKYGLMNQMLKSRIEDWSEYLLEIFKINSSSQYPPFWRFIGDLSAYMPTPALQMSIFEMKQWISSIDNLEPTTEMNRLLAYLRMIKAKCTRTMRRHVASLGEEGSRPSESRFVNIFTKEQQERMGKYAIHLETSWPSSHDEEGLIRYWASNLDVYLQVEGTLQGMLEKQVILIDLAKEERRLSSKVSHIPKLYPVYDHWVGARVGALTKELIDYISSLNDEDLKAFAKIQSKTQLGFKINTKLMVKDIRNMLMFWTHNSSLYLQINGMPEKDVKFNLIEQFIVQDPDHLNLAMQDLIKSQGYTQTENFLQSLHHRIQSPSPKRIAEGAPAFAEKNTTKRIKLS